MRAIRASKKESSKLKLSHLYLADRIWIGTCTYIASATSTKKNSIILNKNELKKKRKKRKI